MKKRQEQYMSFILAPQYYQKFKCLCGSCSDDCCRRMLISIDEETYNKYASLQEGAIRNKVLGNIEVTNSFPFKAKIKLDDSSTCPFLKPDGLCCIQSEYGHDFLSYACRTYPRTFCDAGGKLEAYMSLGCEAAAKYALLNPEPMKLGEIHLSVNVPYKSTLEPSKYRASDDAFNVFWKLRDASISILQLRKYKLWFRVVMLGFYIQKIEQLLSAATADELSAVTGEYILSLEDVDYEKLSDKIPGRYDIKISRIYAFFEFLSKNMLKEQRNSLSECFDRTREGLGIHGIGQPMQEATDSYIQAKDQYFTPFFESKEHILENYIVNFALSSGFPFSYRNEKSIYDNFVRVACKYSMVKFLLTGTAGYYKENMIEDEAVKTIAVFSRFFDHDKKLSDAIIDSFNTNMSTDITLICTLVKD